MKKQTIFRRILLPAMIALLLLPPLSCLIFRRTAENYAYAEAIQELELLQQDIFPILQNSFSDTGSQILELRSKAARPSDPVKDFLLQISSLMRKTNGTAKLMILESRMKVIYPRDEQEREDILPLASDFITYIQENEGAFAGNTTELKSVDGQSYLINVYEVPIESAQIKYVIAYRAVSGLGLWVRDASLLVLIISSVFVLLIFVILWLAACSITRPLHQLCQKADQIGHGSFSGIEPSFRLKELEDLRLAMNRMSGQLEHADRVQRDFFQNVSHELRNPLMSISGYAQGIEQERFSSPKDAARTILAESGRLAALVNSLLTLSRMENESGDFALSLIPVIDAIEECLDRVNGLALKAGITVSLTSFDEALCVYGNEELICKVLENLLTNAIRYAKTAVTISVKPEKELLCISVADDGEGISDKDFPHIFERCYKGNGGNFGIGLAIARSAAQKMGGTLHAANLETGGAVFTLCLKSE